MRRAGPSDPIGETVAHEEASEHLIAEAPRRQPQLKMPIDVHLGDVWSHYCTLNQDADVVGQGRLRTMPKASRGGSPTCLQHESSWRRRSGGCREAGTVGYHLTTGRKSLRTQGKVHTSRLEASWDALRRRTRYRKCRGLGALARDKILLSLRKAPAGIPRVSFKAHRGRPLGN
jgi:hypothetical protein